MKKKSNENSSVLLSTPFVIMPRTASNDRLVAIGLLRAGLTIGDVARRYGVTHGARIITAYLNENNIPVLPWPANSPDMSPIEHVWDEMKRRLRDLENPPQNRQQLQVALVNIWNEIPQAFHGNLVRGMRRRINACIATRGGHTRY